jgi:serine/threonine-protein kinase
VNVQTNDPIGTDFVGYRIEELIGRGGMGVVYRAYDLRLKRTIALKLVAPELALDERFRTRFARETELAMALEHPNVIPIYDAGDVDGRLYLAMRLIHGPDLRGIMRAEGALPPARACALCEQVAAALDAAHAKGLVHRDVKPSNVLVDADDHVYVADLGIGRRLEEAARSGEDRAVGTPVYLAPEELEGLPVDGRADVYSLGCLLFECLTGEAPFTRDSRLALAWAHLEEEPPRASARKADLPTAVDGVLAKALAKAPADRYASCGAFMRDAQQVLGLNRARGSRRVLALLVLAAVAVAAAVTFALLRSHGAAAVPVVHQNALVRIDPATNKVSNVIDVGKGPVATAVGGDSVWVYNRDAHSLAEIDPKAKKARRTVALVSDPDNIGVPQGPFLAADAHGAWLVGVDFNGVGFLTNVQTGVPDQRRLRLDFEPWGVAVGEGSVWVVGGKGSRGELVRVDPSRLIITARKLLPLPVVLDNVTTGFGAVWGVDAARSKLYRIDTRRLKLSRGIDVGPNPGRPWAGFGDIWVEFDGEGTQGYLVNPATLKIDLNLTCCPPRQGSDAAAFGSTWTVNWPSGTVVRWDGGTKQPVGDIHVTGAPQFGAPCMTSIAAGAGAVWVTVGPTSNLFCTA